MRADTGLRPDRFTQDTAREALKIARDAIGAIAVTLEELLVGWAQSGSYQVAAATYDADGVVSSADVVWPDGSLGVFTRTAKSDAWLAVDAYTITHADSAQTVTQAAVTRDANGSIANQPTPVVA